MAKTVWPQVTGTLSWAKVFPENRDMKSTDRKVQKMLDKHEGQYTLNVTVYGDDIALVKSVMSEAVYGGRPRFKDEDDGGVTFVLKRKHKDEKELFNKKTGKDEVINFGGPPEIVHVKDGRVVRNYNVQEDGYIGNGTKALVKFTVYGDDPQDTGNTIRLEKLGIIDLVKYEGTGGEGRF